MTQLTDDCFAFGGDLMPLDTALSLLEDRMVPVTGTETVALTQAVDRFLAEDIIATMDVPPHNNAAVDGYAVYFDDLHADGPTRLPIVGTAAAGHPWTGGTTRGSALHILTGAPIPADAGDTGPDTVLMQEDCTTDGDHVVIPAGIARGANWRARGEDIASGALVLRAGRRLRPADLGMAASLGITHLPVHTPLRVALFSTGDEVRDPGTPLSAGAVYDANRYALQALLSRLRCRVTDLGIVPDRLERIRDTVAAAAADNDMLVSSGGVSTGSEDHVKAVVETLGEITFWRLAIKPGRPLALGLIKDGARAIPYVGLPGNPVAVMVTALRFLRPMILRLGGCTETQPLLYRVRAGFTHRKKPSRREFVRCRLEPQTDDLPIAQKSGRQGAGILSAVASADGLVELPEEMTYLAEGTSVDFLPFADVT